MSESLDGLIVSATRQNAGRFASSAAVPPPGGVNRPAATAFADETVVFWSFSEAASCSHLSAATVCACAETERMTNAAATIAIRMVILLPEPPGSGDETNR